MTDDAAAVRRLADRAAIQDLVHAYATGVDARDLAAVAACFMPDCVYEGSLARGTIADALASLAAAMARYVRTMHFMGTQTIALEGERARAQTCCLAYHVRPDRTLSTVAVRYHDTLVRTPDGWRISARRVETDWSRTEPL